MKHQGPFKYSAVILIEPSDRLNEIDRLRKNVAEKFGGLSALELPVHITVLKWNWNVKISCSLRTEITSCKVDINLLLGEITVSDKYLAVWFDIENSEEIFSVASKLKNILTANGVIESDILTTYDPHLTIAYENYPIETLHQIMQFSKATANLSWTSLKAYRIAVCEQINNDRWIICQESEQ